MSGAPTGFNAPKTNWATTDPINLTDLNRIEGNANATELGSRTLDQALANPANVGTLRQILSWFAGRLRAITGATNWWDAPVTTLATAHAHHAAAAPHTGHETPAGAQARVDAHAVGTAVHGAVVAPTANLLVLRDANGRAQVAAPSVAADIARLDTVTTHAALTTTAHGAVSAPTINTIILRDASGRAQVAAPAVAADIARLDTVTAMSRLLYTGDETEVSVVGTTLTTRKTNRVIKSSANGRDITRIHVLAELRATAGTGFLEVWVNGALSFTLSTASTTYVLVQGNAAVAWADNTVNLIEIRLRNSAANTTFNRVYELYVGV